MLLLLAAQLPHLLHAWAEAGESPDLLARSIQELIDPEFLVRWLMAFGYAQPAAKQLLSRLGPPSLLPPLGGTTTTSSTTTESTAAPTTTATTTTAP